MAPKRGKQTMRSKARDAELTSSPAKENVFLFVPNLIGYARVVLAAISLYNMRDNPKVCTLLYCISCLLDAFDGMFARLLDQSTRFGAVLDMVTDRCTTSCLLCFLAAAYPRCALLFQFLVTLDFSSHYIHMYSTLVSGSGSHKSVDSSRSRILNLYYADNRVLFLFCAFNEIFFVCLYLMDFYKQPLGLDVTRWMPSALVAVLPMHKGSPLYHALHVYIPTLTWPQILGAITFPVCLGKQIINAVQFWKAAKVLVDLDLQDRSKRNLAKRS